MAYMANTARNHHGGVPSARALPRRPPRANQTMYLKKFTHNARKTIRTRSQTSTT